MLMIPFSIFSSAPYYFGNMILGRKEVARSIKGKDKKEVKTSVGGLRMSCKVEVRGANGIASERV